MENRPYRPTPEQAASKQRYTPEWQNPDEKIEDALKRLEDGVYEEFSQDSFKRFLKAQNLFHDYSARNTILILTQNPEATRCASFATWKKLERRVRAGEHGYKIWVPMTSMVERENRETGEKERVQILKGFRTGTTFDISQTEGKPLPESPRPQELYTSSEIGRGIYRHMHQFLEGNGIEVVREPIREKTGALGYFDPAAKRVCVDRFLFEDQAASVILHEGVHALTDARSMLVGKAKAEMVAEGTAFVVADHFGLDTSQWTFKYAAGWAQEAQVVQDSLESIKNASNLLTLGIAGEILKGHEQPMRPDQAYGVN